LLRLAGRKILALALVLASAAVARADVESVYDAGSGSGSRRRTIERARRLLADVLELYPGSTVAVALDDQIVWSAGFGYANARRQVPVTSQTQFRVDRVSEAFTVTALLRLAEEGKVDLDAPVQR
jgi:CubicO group peptidase (beta-lactamase class C family)